MEEPKLPVPEVAAINYPGVSERVKATVMDSMVIVFMIIGATYLFEQFDDVSATVRTAAFVFIFGLYDPVMTSVFGATLGHRSMGIRVSKGSDHQQKIAFPLAMVRYVIKALLGWLSLLTVGSSKDKRAIHDMAVGSVVLYR